MIEFYRDVMGFPVKFDMKRGDGTPFGWYFAIGGNTFVEIFDQKGAVKEWGGEVVPLEAANGTQYRHFCFEVDNLDGERQRLIALGVEVTPIKMGMDNSYQCWIKDPDGNDIELMAYTDKSMQLA